LPNRRVKWSSQKNLKRFAQLIYLQFLCWNNLLHRELTVCIRSAGLGCCKWFIAHWGDIVKLALLRECTWQHSILPFYFFFSINFDFIYFYI
jgi:hypothetical protein